MSQDNRFRVSPPRRFAVPWLAALVAVTTACELAQPPTETVPEGDASLLSDLFGNSAEDVGRPLRFLGTQNRILFGRGSAQFQVEFTPELGLGPLFNAVGCANCHENPVVGGAGGGEEEPGEEGEDVEVHATAFQGATCDNLSAQGGPVFQKEVTDALNAALGLELEEPAASATAVAQRTTPDLFGFGLLDAVPAGTILAMADPFDRNRDGISGRAHRTADGRIGRFGRKAQVARLDDFNAEAFVMEMGITNPGQLLEQFPGGPPGSAFPEGVDPTPKLDITPEQLTVVNAFVRFLAPPRHLEWDLAAIEGRLIFSRIGCASCHVPALRTGPNRVRVLSDRVVHAYTDLLLHDMGPDLADICMGDAQPSEFRTEPLMGLRLGASFLHDGRATTIEEAVLAHGGEAERARTKFAGLPGGAKVSLLKFLSTL